MRWSTEFYAWRAGEGCPTCAEGRPEATAWGVRWYADEVCDASLVRADVQAGLTIAVFRGWPFPFPDPEPPAAPVDRLQAQAARLRRAVAEGAVT